MSVDKANQFMAQGDKALKAWFKTSATKHEEAQEYYSKAAQQFKLGKHWDQAGWAFVRSADMHQKLDSKYERCSELVNAASMYKRSNVAEAVRHLTTAIELSIELGKMQQCAKYEKEIAELLEQEKEWEECVTHYRKAADFYSGEDSHSSANNMLLKVAQYSAHRLKNYQDAIDIYEEVARKSLDNNLLKWSVRDYLFKAFLCHLASLKTSTSSKQDENDDDKDNALDRNDNDNSDENKVLSQDECVDKLRTTLQDYGDMDVNFPTSAEYRLCEAIVKAFEESDEETFSDAVRDYDDLKKLDEWKSALLLRGKHNLKGLESSGLK